MMFKLDQSEMSLILRNHCYDFSGQNRIKEFNFFAPIKKKIENYFIIIIQYKYVITR